MIKQLLTTAPLLLLLLAGCTSGEPFSKETEIPGIPEGEYAPLSVESAVIEAEVTTSTRAALGSGSIGVFLTGTGYTAKNNMKYNYATPAWTPQDVANTIYLGSANANVCAYYPYAASSMTLNGFTLTSQVYDAAKELSFATNQTVNGAKTGSPNRNVAFALTRAYSRVNVIVKRHATNYPGTCQVTALKLKNILASTTLNISNGTQAATTSVVANEVSATSFSTTLTAGSTTQKDFLTVPCTFASTTVNSVGNCGLTIQLTVDGRTMTTGILTTKLPKMEKGKQYTVTVTINGTSLGVGTVTEAADWTNTPIDAGDALPVA